MKALFLLLLTSAIFGSAGWFAYELFYRPHLEAQAEADLPPAPPPPDPSLPELRKAMEIKEAGDPIESRAVLREFLDRYPDSTKLDEAKDALGEVNSDIFFSTIPAPEKIEYVVKSGDSLSRIERQLKTRGELIMKANGLDDPRRLQIGQRLMINQPDFAMLIDRANKRVVLYNHRQFFKQYPVKTWKPAALRATTGVTTKVQDDIAWKDGERVSFGSKDYLGSARWVTLSLPGWTLYTDPPPEGAEAPGAGLGLGPEPMEEISTLVGRGTPVTID